MSTATDFSRAMYVWIKDSDDPLATGDSREALATFAAARGVDVIFLAYWRYLGMNPGPTKEAQLANFIALAGYQGVRVFALGGDVSWGTQGPTVMRKNIAPVLAYNARNPGCEFAGFHFDIEYWTNEALYPAATHCPGVLGLVEKVRKVSGLPVGLFLPAFLLKPAGSIIRPLIYGCQEGELFLSHADHVVVAAYRNTAAAQITQLDPWLTPASTASAGGIYCGSETTDVQPPTITYFGKSKAEMEAQIEPVGSVARSYGPGFLGHAIHSYAGWKAMP